MSTPAATPLKINGHSGWFAAAAGWQAALEKLSDGAFKLFVHISLSAERSTGRFLFRQQDLAKALRKSRRSIGTYLQELEERQVCRVRRSSNQHAPGVLEIAEEYWPYQRRLAADSLSSARSAQTLYVEAIGEMLLERPCIRCLYSASDRRLAARWFQQGLELEDIRQAILLGCGRKYARLAQWSPGAAHWQPALLQPRFTGGHHQPTLRPLLGFQSNPSAATREALAGYRERLQSERRSVPGKTFPKHNRPKSTETR